MQKTKDAQEEACHTCREYARLTLRKIALSVAVSCSWAAV